MRFSAWHSSVAKTGSKHRSFRQWVVLNLSLNQAFQDMILKATMIFFVVLNQNYEINKCDRFAELTYIGTSDGIAGYCSIVDIYNSQRSSINC